MSWVSQPNRVAARYVLTTRCTSTRAIGLLGWKHRPGSCKGTATSSRKLTGGDSPSGGIQLTRGKTVRRARSRAGPIATSRRPRPSVDGCRDLEAPARSGIRPGDQRRLGGRPAASSRTAEERNGRQSTTVPTPVARLEVTTARNCGQLERSWRGNGGGEDLALTAGCPCKTGSR